MLEQKRQDISYKKGNPCEQWSNGRFSAVEKFVFFNLTNDVLSILIKNVTELQKNANIIKIYAVKKSILYEDTD